MTSIQLPIQFDLEGLRRDWEKIELDEYYWIENTSLQKQTLRGLNFVHPKFEREVAREREFFFSEVLLRSPAFLEAYHFFQCEVTQFRLHTLLAGAEIQGHRDVGFSLNRVEYVCTSLWSPTIKCH